MTNLILVRQTSISRTSSDGRLCVNMGTIDLTQKRTASEVST